MDGIWRILGRPFYVRGSFFRNLTKTVDTMQQMANDINKIKRSFLSGSDTGLVALNLVPGDLLQKESRSWLSPPDPSPNYNIACEIRQDGTSMWFFQGSVFTEWNAKGSLLWIHGKRAYFDISLATILTPFPPLAGSGKSILLYVVSHCIQS